MKRSTNTVSPFIMLLIPLFLLMGLVAINANHEMPAAKQKASVKLQVPSLKDLVRAAL
jgi:hypothetical protein